MSDPAEHRVGRKPARQPRPPSDRDWERSILLEPYPGPRHPDLISDGGGLPFPPSALAGPHAPLDPDDPAAATLLAHLLERAPARRGSRVPWKRGDASPPAPPPTLDGWRELARTTDEVLFARGLPPRMLTAALRRTGRRRTWAFVGSSAARPLRAARDGIRASSWRLDPPQELTPEETVLRVLVTEQAYASGRRADGRVLAPAIYVDAHELILTIYIAPEPGFQNGTPNPETPVRIQLPHPVGSRRVIDGSLVEFSEG